MGIDTIPLEEFESEVERKLLEKANSPNERPRTIESAFVPKQHADAEMNPEITSLVKALFSPDGATQKTVLNGEQVIKLARAEAFADMFNIPELGLLCEYLMQLKISEKGRGRTDLVKALQSRQPQYNPDEIKAAQQGMKLIGKR